MKASGVGQYAIYHPPMLGGRLKAGDLPSQLFDFGVFGFDGDEFYFQKSILERIPSQLAGLKMKLEEVEESAGTNKAAVDEPGATGAASTDDVVAPTPDAVPALRTPSHHRLEAENLPPFVNELVEEFNDSLGRGNRNAAALLSRKILHTAIFTAMQRKDKGDDLTNTEGEEVDLRVALARCSSEYGISQQVQSRVTSAKWIGDSANHSYRLRINQADVDQLTTGLRLFLAEVFGGQSESA
jgi:hypothetical protein